MFYERTKLLIRRLFYLALLVFLIIKTIAFFSAPPKEILIADHNGYVDDDGNCEIEVTFNSYVDVGTVTVAFYDSNGELLSTRSDDLYGFGKTLSTTFYSVGGEIDSYEILDYSVSVLLVNLFTMIFLLAADACILEVFVKSLLFSCKVCKYKGKKIGVYAGRYHRYIKVNGTKTDVHNTLKPYTAIYLFCTLHDGTTIDATITRMNRISVKINGQLYRKERV